MADTNKYGEAYGDIRNHVKGLDKDEPLETNPPKRSGLIPTVRHNVKEYLKNLIKH